LSDVADTKRIMNGRYGALAGSLMEGKMKDFVDALSGETKLLGVTGENGREVHKSGLDGLIGRLDIGTKDEFQEIARDFEGLDRRMEELRRKMRGQLPAPQVFIGKESPLTESKNLSVILDQYDVGDRQIVVAIIGPKRMDYGKNLKLMKLFRSYLNEHE